MTNEDLGWCLNNGGKKIFPGKLSPTDGSPALRRTVKLVATLATPIPGVDVYFRVFDVDDPFDQLNVCDPADPGKPCVANVDLIDNSTSGPDNRPTPEGSSLASDTSDENGRASITLTVSMQPGDNYRAAASVIPEAVGDPFGGGQLRQADADALGFTGDPPQAQANGSFGAYKVPVVWSQMLTVWRKLWIERDTMQPPTAANRQATGQLLLVEPNVPEIGRTRLTLDLDYTVGFDVDLNNYEEGTVTLGNCPFGLDTFPVIESGLDAATVNGAWILVVLGVPGTCADASPFALVDDDDPDVLGTLADPHFPEGGALLPAAFAPAYVLPVYAGSQFRNTVPFEEYLDAFAVEYGIGTWNDTRNLTSSQALWACLVVGAWEGSDFPEIIPADGNSDPDTCFHLLFPPHQPEGAESPVTGVTDSEDGNALVFLQTLADEAVCNDQTDEAHTFVHEVAHTCGDLHHKDWTIMHVGAPKDQSRFDADQLRIIREQNPW